MVVVGRERLVRAGLKLFAEHGFAGASVRQIASEAGVSIGLIRSHFGSKEGLRREVDAYVLQEVGALHDTVLTHPEDATWESLPEDAADWIERDRDVILYLRTALMERGPASQHMFDELLSSFREFVSRNRELGLLQDDVDEEWAAIYLIFDLLGPAIIEPFAHRALGASMYTRPMVIRRNTFMRRLVTRGFLQAAPVD